MAITLDIREYCSECCDFEADVTKPERTVLYGDTGETITRQTDTIVHCRYAKRCEAIKRYLSQQKGGKE